MNIRINIVFLAGFILSGTVMSLCLASVVGPRLWETPKQVLLYVFLLGFMGYSSYRSFKFQFNKQKEITYETEC